MRSHQTIIAHDPTGFVRERVRKFGRIGACDSTSRDWVASMALAEKLFPDYKE